MKCRFCGCSDGKACTYTIAEIRRLFGDVA
jgi:hypothetical protein